MKHIFFVMLIVLSIHSIASADNEVRLVLHATGPELVPHLSLGAWIIQPNLLAIGGHDASGNPLPTSALAVVGPRLFWKGDKEDAMQLLSLEFLGGCVFTKEKCTADFDVRVILNTSFVHIFGKNGITENSVSPTISAEYPLTIGGNPIFKVGIEYDAMYIKDADNIERLGPRLSLPFTKYFSGSTTFQNFLFENPRTYLTFTAAF